MEPRIGELFAGYGGLGLGLQAVLGGDIAWYSEIDKGALKILEHRFPDVPNVGDITTVKWTPDCPTCGDRLALYWNSDLADGRGYYCPADGWFPLDIRVADPDAHLIPEPIEILCGGFPCQDVSGAGNRLGMRPDTRSGLWSQFAYAIDQLRPRMVVIENVRGLASAEAHCEVEPCTWCMGDDPDRPLRALGAVLGDLADLGFDAEWFGLHASDIGAPHGRFRIFIAAWPTDTGTVLPRRPTLGRAAAVGDPDGALLPTPGAYDADRGGPQHPDKRRAGGHSVSLQDALHGLTLLPTPAVNDMGEGKTVERWDEWTAEMQAKHDNGNGHGKSLAIEAQRLLPTPTTTQRGTDAKAETRPDAGPNLHNAVNSAVWGDYADAIARWERIVERLAPAPTHASIKGNPQLSAEFVEWMMGLPAGWVTEVPDLGRSETLKALGNGVVPQQAEAALRFLLDRIETPA